MTWLGLRLSKALVACGVRTLVFRVAGKPNAWLNILRVVLWRPLLASGEVLRYTAGGFEFWDGKFLAMKVARRILR